MSEVVTIISVSTTAVLGVGSLVAATWGGSRERRWQSREERAVELRAVLEDGASKLAELMFKIDEAHNEVRRLGRLAPATEVDFEARHQSIVLALSRVGVRRGSRAPEYTTFASYWLAISKLDTLLAEANGEGLDSEQKAAYTSAWTEALAAGNAYLDATANALGPEESLPRRRQVLPRSRSMGGSATQ